MEDVYKNYTSTSMLVGLDESELTGWSMQYFARRIVPHFPKNKSAKILELGCGYGRYIQSMGMLGFSNVRGIDISEEQIKYAQVKLGLRNVQIADAISFLDICGETYDVIIMLDVLEHLEVDYSLEIIRKAHDRLNQGGKLIIQVPNAISPLSVNRHWDITHKRAYSTHSMEQSLRIGGFENIQCHSLPPFSWDAKSFIRSVLWQYLLNPLISTYLRIAVGGRMGGIYTENLLSVSTKN